MRRSLPLLFAVALLLGLGSLVLLTTLSLSQPAEPRSLHSTYAHVVLRVSIPDEAPRSGEGSLTIEILDPEDRVAARIDRPSYASAGRGVWRQELVLPTTL